ncbi:MAG: hypothetical protein KY450_14550 [Actinobacteria bacterium]|nr:hypothetical protein [Actinomycetota bacterium]
MGHADGLRITVVVDRDARVVSAYPEPGQRGVYHNPLAPDPPPGASRPVWTREDGRAGVDGYWTWRASADQPLHTDRGGQPLRLGDDGHPVPPPLPAVPIPPVLSDSSECGAKP